MTIIVNINIIWDLIKSPINYDIRAYTLLESKF